MYINLERKNGGIDDKSTDTIMVVECISRHDNMVFFGRWRGHVDS